MPDGDLHGLDSARVRHCRRRRLAHRTDDPVGALISVIAADCDECPDRRRQPADKSDLQEQAQKTLADLAHREKDGPREKKCEQVPHGNLPIFGVYASISAQPVVGESTQKESRVGPRLSASPQFTNEVRRRVSGKQAGGLQSTNRPPTLGTRPGRERAAKSEFAAETS